MTLAIQALQWTEAGVPHIDVRGLPPPQPLVAILRRLQAVPPPDQLVVHHDRMPVLLFPELQELRWGAERIPAPEGEVRLLLKPWA